MRTRGRLTVHVCGCLAAAALAVTFVPAAAPRAPHPRAPR